jgi:hypothetical protein
MKINRFFALIAIALLVVGAMGAISLKVFAKGVTVPPAQVSVQAVDCSQDQENGTEVKSATDTDNVEQQCGDQNGVDTGEIIDAEDTDNVQLEEQVGDQNTQDTGVEAPEFEDSPLP